MIEEFLTSGTRCLTIANTIYRKKRAWVQEKTIKGSTQHTVLVVMRSKIGAVVKRAPFSCQ